MPQYCLGVSVVIYSCNMTELYQGQLPIVYFLLQMEMFLNVITVKSISSGDA